MPAAEVQERREPAVPAGLGAHRPRRQGPRGRQAPELGGAALERRAVGLARGRPAAADAALRGRRGRGLEPGALWSLNGHASGLGRAGEAGASLRREFERAQARGGIEDLRGDHQLVRAGAGDEGLQASPDGLR